MSRPAPIARKAEATIPSEANSWDGALMRYLCAERVFGDKFVRLSICEDTDVWTVSGEISVSVEDLERLLSVVKSA